MKLQTTLIRSLSPFLIASLLVLPHSPSANASMVTTDTFLEQQAGGTPRDRLLRLVQIEAVAKQLQEYGVTAQEANARIASLSDAEIAKIDAKIAKLPAGSDAAGAIIGTALVVFLVLLLTDILCFTKVFRFTRCAE
ncbi:MAG: PA2779 family protein [Bdellovibrionales bacterium]|nr:PA2779 family protein [Oligoflexia bacterium]